MEKKSVSKKPAAKKKTTPRKPRAKNVQKKATVKTQEAEKVEAVEPEVVKQEVERPLPPPFLLNHFNDYVVGTEDYASLVLHHNELFGTSWNRFRLRPAVFISIFRTVKKHYDG